MHESPSKTNGPCKRSPLRYLHFGLTLLLLGAAGVFAVLAALGRLEIRVADRPAAGDSQPSGSQPSSSSYVTLDEEGTHTLSLLGYHESLAFKYSSDNYLVCWLEVENRAGADKQKQVEIHQFGDVPVREKRPDEEKPLPVVLSAQKGAFVLVFLGPMSAKDEEERTSYVRFGHHGSHSQRRIAALLQPRLWEHMTTSKVFTYPEAQVNAELLLWRRTVTLGIPERANTPVTTLSLKARFVTKE
jgi:hypothetical protein